MKKSSIIIAVTVVLAVAGWIPYLSGMMDAYLPMLVVGTLFVLLGGIGLAIQRKK